LQPNSLRKRTKFYRPKPKLSPNEVFGIHSWEAIWASTKEASWSLGTIVVIFGGIYGGIFTPTEAAGVAVVYSLFITMVIHREIGIADFWRIIMSAVILISQIMASTRLH
jgi:TRAP-type C4-dicarboxylate transport system permease large subunit